MTPEETKEIVINMIMHVTKISGQPVTFEEASKKFDLAAKANYCADCAKRMENKDD